MIRYMCDAMNELGDIVLRADNKCTDAGIPCAAMVQAGACASRLYEPMLHLVLQGSKTLFVGDRLLDSTAGLPSSCPWMCRRQMAPWQLRNLNGAPHEYHGYYRR